MPDTRNKPVFYSANFGSEEPRRPIQVKQSGVTVLFTDTDEHPAGWDHVVRVSSESLAPTTRLAARYLKMTPHRLFPHSPYTVWFDATHDPVVDLACLESAIKYSPIACFAHPRRTTAAQEIEICVEYKMITRETADEIYQWFKRVGFRDNYGLYGTACTVRKDTLDTRILNETWWWACHKWPPRDQIFLPWVLSLLEIAPQCLEGKPRGEPFISGKTYRPNPYFDVTVW